MRWFFVGSGRGVFEWVLATLWRHPAVVLVVAGSAAVGVCIGAVTGRLQSPVKYPWERHGLGRRRYGRARAVLAAVAVAVVVPLVGVTVVAARGVAPWSVPWSRRDLDCSGSVSVAEWYAAGLDYGWRAASEGPAGCWEVFSLKDGVEVTRWCPTSSSCRQVR